MPRITYGRIVERPAPPDPSDLQDSDLTNPSETQRGDRGNTASDPKAVGVAQAFGHVKRDLVRLLGVLASNDRAVQDRVRICDGIPVVMNLCVVDDYNPCECPVQVLAVGHSPLPIPYLGTYCSCCPTSLLVRRPA